MMAHATRLGWILASSLALSAYARASCGDGVIEVGEACDDGDLDPGDGCSLFCTIEAGSVCGTADFPTSTGEPGDWLPGSVIDVNGPSANWVVDPATPWIVDQTINCNPSIWISNFDPAFHEIEFTIEIADGAITSPPLDDDFIGFTLGYSDGEHQGGMSTDYLVVDWKATTQTTMAGRV